MPKLVGIIVIIVMVGVGFFLVSCSDKPEEKIEKQLIIQETESTNSKLSNR